jgi:serine phosphatase RsbU (regulator of sigma subunit)
MTEYKGSKFSIGGMRSGNKHFEEINIKYNEDDVLYMYTDGYTDQFGGNKGKKYSSKRLKEFFLAMHQDTASNQKSKLDIEFNGWMSTQEQVDDILVMGIRF